MLTPKTLQAAIDCSTLTAEKWCNHLNHAMCEYEIDTPARVCAFLAQIAHESCGLVALRELWGPTKAQIGYEGRKDLGNFMPGDGKKYRGRGLIQITGRANYNQVGIALGIPAEENPLLLEEPDNAALSAAWFWKEHGLNELADEGDFARITRRINGRMNGYAQRLEFYKLAKAALT